MSIQKDDNYQITTVDDISSSFSSIGGSVIVPKDNEDDKDMGLRGIFWYAYLAPFFISCVAIIISPFIALSSGEVAFKVFLSSVVFCLSMQFFQFSYWIFAPEKEHCFRKLILYIFWIVGAALVIFRIWYYPLAILQGIQ